MTVNESTSATAPTTYGVDPEFDYDTFRFSDVFPVPAEYIVVDGMPHFRGPDGHLWFVPDTRHGAPSPWEWDYPQNVAAHDIWLEGDGQRASDYLAFYARLCRAVDLMTRYQTDRNSFLRSGRTQTGQEA